MSVEAISWALRVPIGGTRKIVLVGLANHATAEFEHARPAVATLAKYAYVSPRNVQMALRRLEADGWIEKTGEHPVDGRADRSVNVYRLRIERGDDCITPRPDGVMIPAPRGDAGDTHGVTLASPEPSLEPSKGKRPPLTPPPGGNRKSAIRDWEKGFVTWAYCIGVSGPSAMVLKAGRQHCPWATEFVPRPAREFREFCREHFPKLWVVDDEEAA